MTKVSTKSYHDDGQQLPICAQAVDGGWQARVLGADQIPPLWKGEIHPTPEAALDEARSHEAVLLDETVIIP